MRHARAVTLCLVGGLLAVTGLARVFSASARADDISERAHKLQFSSIVLDTHDDTTQRFFTNTFDIGTVSYTHLTLPTIYSV